MQIQKVENKSDLKRFIDFPFLFYKNDENWVPPLRVELKNQFNPKTNPFLDHCDYQLFLLIRDGKVIGRIAAFVDHLAVDFWKEKIGLLESIFPTTLLYRAMDNDSELSLLELENRAKKLFDRYYSLGVYLDKVSAREGEMTGIREIVDRAIVTINCNPFYRMFRLETREFLRAKSGRLFSLDPKLHQWYANNIRHLDA